MGSQYLCKILGQWDIFLLNLTFIGFMNSIYTFFVCYNICICKKGKVKEDAYKKICETNGGQIKEQDVLLT